MKQPDFKRKALGLLIAPLALTALPLSAATLDVNRNYNGYYEFCDGTDDQGNRLIFYLPNDEECIFVGVETSNSSVTIPETINLCINEGWMDPETGEMKDVEYRVIDVNGFNLCDDWYYILSSLGNAQELTDITLPNNITSVDYRQVDYHAPINIHFTSENVPEYINIENREIGDWLYSRTPISVPETALDAYKGALDPNRCMVITEGTDPKDAFEKEIADLNGLPIVYDDDCVPYASWSATDENGTLFAFEYPYDDITFRGAITKEKSITIPDYVYQSNPEWYALRKCKVSRFCLDYYNEENNGFPGSDNLTDIYVPAHLTYAEFHGEGYAARINFHFKSEEVPAFYFYDGSGNFVNIYVPDELFLTYADGLGNQDYVLWSETPATPINVNVSTPGTLAEQVSAVIDDLSSVRWLVVTGTPDEIDLRMIRRLPRLEILDLSATTGLNSVGGCNGLRYLSEVILPEGITSIDNSAFQYCYRLKSINIPEGVSEIGSHAFYDNYALKNINLPTSVARINDHAFEYSGLASANLDNVEYFDYCAFRCSKLTDVALDAAIEIGSHAFESCRIENVTFGPNVGSIGDYAFNDNRISGVMEIPNKVTYVDDGIFENNPEITKFIIHNKVKRIGGNSFRSSNSKLESIECNILFPTDGNGCDNMDLSKVTLYVPSLTISEYLLHDNWLNFANIDPLPYDLTALDIDREYVLKSDKGVADKVNVNMQGGEMNEFGHLTVNRNKDLNIGNFNMSGRYYDEFWDPYYGWTYGEFYNGATIIPESNVTAETINLNMTLRTDRWTFLSFPFDVNVKDIDVDEDALWVVRKYSGEARANLDENTWQNMTDETVLKAGEGYIFNCAAEGRSEVNVTFCPAANGNALFAKDAVENTLAVYPSEFAHNASWNLAGNTYPAYLNVKGVEFDAPITIWQRGTYYAYAPADDDLVLEPFQAFFVQALNQGDVLKLNPAARAHSRKAATELSNINAARAPRINSDRALFNIYINGENGSDRTRLVINEEASAAYESNCDASKFMSTEQLVPQIFVNNNNVRMAIDERPFGIGEFTLGARFGQKGQYTISLDSRNAESYTVILIDNVTGETTELSAADYVFDAEASTNDARFTLVLSGSNTGVDAAVVEGLDVNVDGNVLNIRSNDAVEISVAAIDGKVVAAALSNDFSAELENGIYIVKVGQKTMKIKVGK